MISLWTAILVALVPAASALLAAYMTNKATERRLEIQASIDKSKELGKIKLVKAEEAYSQIILYKRNMFNTHVDWVRFSREEINSEGLLENAKEGAKKVDTVKISTILGLYFPSLYEEFEESRDLLSPANQCYFNMTSGRDVDPQEKKKYANIILDTNEIFEKAIDNILLKISKQVNELHTL